MRKAVNRSDLAATGLNGLDVILQGGLPKGRAYLVEGPPGAGKTTLALQFLLEGVRTGERVMLVSLIETYDELLFMAKSHGWNLDDVHVMELPQNVRDSVSSVQTVFPPAEVEFGEIADAVIAGIEKYRPDRLLLDSVSQLSMLTESWYQLRGPILRIRDLLHRLKCTTLLTSNNVRAQTSELDTIVHGSITLEMKAPAYGQILRQMIVKKMRGQKFISGYHNYRIRTGGLEVYTCLKPKKEFGSGRWQVLSSGIRELDELLGGGLEEGTTCILNGNTGSGKSTLSSIYVEAAAKRGENSIILCFDERKDTFLRRCRSLKMDIAAYVEQGLVELHQVDTGELSPGEFAQIICKSVEQKKTRVVVIDSLTGYFNAMGEEKRLMAQMHDLLNYLSGAGVLTIMAVSKHGALDSREAEVDASYFADTVILLRHFEALGTIRHCIAVVKKRQGNHEHAIREFKIATGGCQVGPPLNEFRGVLTGNPVYIGKPDNLFAYPQKG
jgi:circadian clock protein KaiC